MAMLEVIWRRLGAFSEAQRLGACSAPGMAAPGMAAPGMAAPRLVIIAEFHVKPECVAECERVLCESARASRAEPGCVRFDVLRDHADPCRYAGRCRWAWPSLIPLLADGGLRMQLLYRACASIGSTLPYPRCTCSVTASPAPRPEP